MKRSSKDRSAPPSGTAEEGAVRGEERERRDAVVLRDVLVHPSRDLTRLQRIHLQHQFGRDL